MSRPPGTAAWRQALRRLTRGGWRDALRNRAGPTRGFRGVRWHGTDSIATGAYALAYDAAQHRHSPDEWVLSVGDGGAFHQAVDDALSERQPNYRSLPLEAALALPETELEGLVAIVCGFADARGISACSRALQRHPQLSSVAFEYCAGLEPERALFQRLDEYRDARFVAPAMIDEVPVFEIYEQSLQHFEQKCGFRDYLDLQQGIQDVIARGVAGDIAEFGAYKGHSGHLIARLLEHLDADRRLFLFDTFEAFPEEALGVDAFWSGTHLVRFADVQRHFARFPQVKLVQGEFGKTLHDCGLGALALAYVDCDSYRAVRYLAEQLWEQKIVPGGVMIFEDYGHPALLGCRNAVHEFFDGRSDCLRWYSHFSGLYFAVKLGGVAALGPESA